MSPRADVYAGDLGSVSKEPCGVADYEFRVVADATPDVLLRIAIPFNVANTAPVRASLRTCEDGQIEFEIRLPHISASLAENIARKLDQLLIVTRVHVERDRPMQ
jgi:hypothetical protein